MLINKKRGGPVPALWRWLALVAATWLPVKVATAADFPALAALEAHGARVSAMAVDLDSGKVIWQRDPRSRLTPASVSKLYTAAAALNRWGPNHHFTTRLLRDGKIRNGILHGNLIFLGAGDPSLDDRDLWSLVQQLRAQGIQRIDGHLEINQSLFGSVSCSAKDRCKAQTATDHAYDAPLSAAGVDFATWCVAVWPAEQVGRPANVTWCQVPVPSVRLNGQVATVAGKRREAVVVSRRTRGDDDRLFVSGHIPLGSDPTRIYRSVSDPAQQTGTFLQALLENVGIEMTGGFAVSDRPPPATAQTLATAEGLPLSDQLFRMMTYSNNYMADMLALDLVAYGDPAGPVTLDAAGQHLQELAKAAARRMRDHITVGDGSPTFHSGSGLTVDNALSAADIVALLSDIYHRSDLFPPFLGVLSVPRYSPMHMLNHGNPDWLSRLSVKTGSLNDPYSVMALAGYYRTSRGGWRAFAAIINGSDRWRHVPFADALAAIRKDVTVLLKSQ
jgi:D-alanyl-D-alanine carboxypeptidase/D-alanyl-D-alanine-endopeptidase (penicillin-binding protein 4)